MLKEKLKELHGNKHQDCNFGLTKFNLKKKDVKLSAEEVSKRNKPTKPPHGGGVPPPPPPPPPLPTITGTIFLDFTGYTVTGTTWNYNGDLVCTPANLSSGQVDEIIASVQENYALYNVIVTVDEAVYNAAPIGNKTRVILTETWEWYGQTGGVALIGSFFWTTETPCFVFTSLLGYSTKKIKGTTSHEVGHTIGLYHQSVYDTSCIKISEYNAGNSECACAPIMGKSYDQPDGKWWVGPSSRSCTDIQDDAAIIQLKVGLK